MEKDIIKDLLESYNLTPDVKTITTFYNIIQLGFDYRWLRNLKIIREFDKLYKTDMQVMEIYGTLSIENKDLSIDQIRKIIRDRQLYEI